MNKIELDIAGLTPSHSSSSDSYILILNEKGRENSRRLPIVIGFYEAQSIAVEIEGISPSRPMTHDLFLQFAHELQFELMEIIIRDVQEGVFFANIVIQKSNGENGIIDARPSDAIAIALRFGIPVYASTAVMDDAGIIFEDDQHEDFDDEDEIEFSSEEDLLEELNIDDVLNDDLESKSLSDLETELSKALSEEDYELARQLQEEIAKRKS